MRKPKRERALAALNAVGERLEEVRSTTLKRLPRSEPAAVDEPFLDEIDAAIAAHRRLTALLRPMVTGEKWGGASSKQPPKLRPGLRVLVVDDEPKLLRSLRRNTSGKSSRCERRSTAAKHWRSQRIQRRMWRS